MIFKFLDLEKLLKDVPEVKTEKILNSRKQFHPEGLFSEQIFGPIKDYTCQCGIRNNVDVNTTCPKCGVKYISSTSRRYSIAKIKLPYKILHPVVYLLTLKKRNKLVRILSDIIMGSAIWRKNSDGEWEKTDETFLDLKDFYDIIEDLVKEISPFLYERMTEKTGSIFINHLLVLPPNMRPVIITHKDVTADVITSKYRQILARIEQLNKIPNVDKMLYYQYDTATELSRAIYELMDIIYDSINGSKNKLIRKHLLAKRTDFSGRTVIIVDPDIKMDWAGISDKLLVELFKPEIIKELKKREYATTSQEASDIIDRYKRGLNDIFDIIKDVCYGKVVLLNRQPTLHRMGLFAFYVEPKRTLCIHIHPLVTEVYNADFDGDQMAIYRPLTEEAVKEAKEKMLPSKNLINISKGTLNFVPTQSIVYGLYLLTKENGNYDLYDKIKLDDGTVTTVGRKMFNDILPDDYPYLNELITKKKLNNILLELAYNYDSKIVIDFLDKIKELGFRIATEYPIDISLHNYYVPEITYEYKKNNVYTGKPFENVKNENEAIEKFWDKFPLHELIDSSTRGNKVQAKQLFFARGHISNFKGELIETPIINNLIDGLTPEEFFISCYGTRKGLIDTAENTADSGYLTRQLVYALSGIELGTEKDKEELKENYLDCGTNEGIEVEITENNYDKYIGRYVIDNGKTRLINKNDIGKIVLLRTPLRCKNTHICHKCYGDMSKIVNSRYIGIIAAQAIGEINTQNVLRTFHTSGAAVVKGDSKKQSDIVSDLDKVKLVLSGKIDNMNEMLSIMQNVYWGYSKIQSIHLEILISNLLWAYDENNEEYYPWRRANKDEKVIAISRIQAIKYQSKMLSFLFAKRGADFAEILAEQKDDNNILVKFMFNKI